MRHLILPVLSSGLLACLPGACTEEAAPPDTVATDKAGIEAEIYPSVAIEGEARQSLPERMRHFGVVQVSVAVFRDGELDWAEGYGEGTDVETQFQAASLSKAVAATGIVALAQELGVSLDEDISDSFEGVDPNILNPHGAPITLRGLLSHTNGATVSGFPGYAAGNELPDSLEVVTGSPRTNTSPVTIMENPDRVFSYSGGGFQLAQLWAEQASGEDFASLMERLVLEPVGMSRSTFDILTPTGDGAENIAPAYGWDGEPVDGLWHRYPEQAAAGLWTTPADYGRFLAALMAAADGAADTGIAPSVAKEVTAPVSDEYGLGVGIVRTGKETVLRHGGSNNGYRSYFEAWPARGAAFVSMSGSPGSPPLHADIARTAKQAYGWPMEPMQQETRVDLPAEKLKTYAGHYARSGTGEGNVMISATPPNLTWTSADGAAHTLVPIGPAKFIDPDDGEVSSFTETEGVMVLTAGDTQLERIAAE